MKKVAAAGTIAAVIEGNSHGQLMSAVANQGDIRLSYSGSARNIVENLARMGVSSALVSLAGDDFVGRGAKRELEQLGVDTQQIRLLKKETTPVSVSILNMIGDMEVGLNNGEVMEKYGKKHLQDTSDVLKNADIAVLDGDFSKDALEYITEELNSSKVPIFFDPVSPEKAEKAAEIIGRFHTIKPDREEAEALSGLEIFSAEQLKAAGKYFTDRGVSRIFITMGRGGVYYKDGNKEGIIRPEEESSDLPEEEGTLGTAGMFMKTPTGAGDAFSAGAVYGFVNDWDVEKTARFAMAAAGIAMESDSHVNPQMDIKKINERI